jgi:hypothetical protein
MSENQEPLKPHGDKLDPEGRGIDRQPTQRQGTMDPRNEQANDGSLKHQASPAPRGGAGQAQEDQDEAWQRAGGYRGT